jgi:signal transduction histidine kinase
MQEKKSTIIDMSGKELQDYFHYLNTVMQIPFIHGLQQKRRVQTIAYFSGGLIGMAAPEEQPQQTIDLLERFAAVFNLTYTRFNDLKIAEKQALQAEKDLIAIKQARQKAEEALKELQATQTQLVQQEKLASLGQLTAGIAHEIKNPLNFVNNFSEVSNELIDEVFEELEKLEDSDVKDDIKAILDDIKGNLSKVHEHGTRADSIVKSMLQHSRGGSGKMEATDLNALIKEYTNLSFHGMRAKKNPINVEIDLQLDPNIETVSLIGEDFSRVILNLTSNAFDAMRETAEIRPAKLTVRTKQETNAVVIEVEDNGPGISDPIKDKILQPFFTTKKGTEGTGLGLSITNDIIKAHRGELKILTKEDAGTVFVIHLP